MGHDPQRSGHDHCSHGVGPEVALVPLWQGIAVLVVAALAFAFALEGGATGAAALPLHELLVSDERNLRRVNRRLQCVRVWTWCLIPIVVLVVIAIVQVRH
jgi:hypothetical protein